jgi:hypothetical protein
MGEPIGAIDLGSNQFLRAAPWMSFNEYAREVRQSDLMLSLMLSPHPSYPPLEMMASGKPVVTNTWGAKTAASLRNLSSNCVPCEPTVSSIVDALSEAATRISLGFAPDQPDGGISAPRSWDESLGAAVDRLQVVIHKERSGNSPFVPASLSSGLLHDSHSQMREIRLGLRRESMSARPTPGLLSFITTVFDTKPEYLFELAACVFDQDGGTAFEWFILDNGSSDPSTIAALRQIAEHPCVRLDRVDRNLGIVGGMRRCLEQATGTYVMPLDSDDLIDPDCVAVIASHITEAGAPAIIYSDEDKASEGIRGIPYHKPDWDPVLLLDSCYVAHLCVFNRQIALDLGVYSSSEAEGCHDWDTMIRFAGAGHLPYHIPEILYSWRIHPQSTAGNIRSKNFIASSHYSTLSKVVRERQLSRIEVEPSPLFSSGVDWRFRRLTVELPSLQLVNVTASKATIAARRAPVACDLTELLLIAESSSAEFIGLVHAGLPRELDEWFASAIAVFELHPDTQVVGGAVVSGERICAGPIVFGFGNGVGSPDQGRSVSDPGYMATMWKHHSCSAITGGNCVVRREFLLATLREIRGHTSIALLGPWLGAMAVRGGFRVVYSPFMSLLARSVLEEECSNSDLAAFIVANSDLLPDTRFYSPRFGLDAKRGFLEVHANERDAHCAGLLCIVPNFHSWQQLSSGSRDLRLPRALQVRSVGAVTTVYEGTSLAAFAELADSLRDQGDSLHSWTVLAHGPIAEDKMDLISRMVRSAGGDLIRHPSPLSIMAAMREAIRGVDTDYFVPVDADDLVLPRGLFAVCSEIERLGLPDCLFTDEAQLVDGVASAPYFRPEFDEVLNLESSYIWHACAIRRDAVERFQLFSDDRSTWCHDWDSISRIWLGGGSIRHSEEVVYLWRRHSESTTNKVGGDRRSLESVRNVLEMIRCTRNTPEAFRVEASPIERGGEELRLGLSGEPSLPIACSLAAAMGRKLPNEGLVIVADPSIQVDGLRLAAEAERLIRLHPRIGAVGFSVANRAGLIVDGCEVVDSRGYLFHPWHGMPHTHAGPYALMLKCQTVFATGRLIAVYRFGALKEAIASMSAVPSDPKAFNSAVRRSFGTGQYRAVFSPAVVPTASAAVNHEYSSTVMAARGPSSGLRRYASVPFS